MGGEGLPLLPIDTLLGKVGILVWGKGKSSMSGPVVTVDSSGGYGYRR